MKKKILKKNEDRPLTKAAFWELTEAARTSTAYRADEGLEYIQKSELKVLQDICLQYRFFTRIFADDLAYLVFRAPRGEFKTALAEILSEELGNGSAEQDHLPLYDSFLASIGVTGGSEDLDRRGDAEILSLLDELSRLTKESPFFYAVGLRGMGGECLCQIYLEIMAERLRKNPNLEKISNQVDWRFWDIHSGEEDKAHLERAREVIDDLVGDDLENLEDLKAGYFKGKSAFDKFWDIAHRRARQKSST